MAENEALEKKLEESLKEIGHDKMVEQFMVGEAEKKVTLAEMLMFTKDVVRAVLKLFWRE